MPGRWDFFPLFRASVGLGNHCYGPARSGEGIYCVTAPNEKETAAKKQG